MNFRVPGSTEAPPMAAAEALPVAAAEEKKEDGRAATGATYTESSRACDFHWLVLKVVGNEGL